jgi:hypothetical protein
MQGDVVASIFVEQFDMPSSAREAMAFGAAGERVGEVLAGRTVWCVIALPDARRRAEELREHVDGAAPGVSARALQLRVPEQLAALAERLQQMLAGRPGSSAGFGAAEREACAEGALDGDRLIGEGVEADDVVVVHDALGALAARALRERRAHVVWRVSRAPGARASGRDALDFLQHFTAGVDAYVLSWWERSQHGDAVERVGAAMPAAGLLATKQFPLHFTGQEPRGLAWTMALAEVARSDRCECVGGTLRARPFVAAR